MPSLLLRRFVAVTTCIAFGSSPLLKAAPDEEDMIVLQSHEVTGTRLKRTENEGPTPVVKIDVSAIGRAGFERPEDYLRQLPFSAGTAQDTSFPTTFQPGITSLSYRGLGYASGLILVNGRRVAPFGQAGAAQLGYDIGSVPIAALETIEIAKDGASAVYGSDAVSGVINYRLRTDFVGTEIQAGYRIREGGGGDFWRAQLLHGMRWPMGRLVLAIEHDDNNAMRYSEWGISRSEDFRPLGGYDFRAPYTFPAHLVVPTGAPDMPAGLTGRLIAPGTANADGTVTLGATAHPSVAGFVALPSPFTNGVSTAGDTRNGLDRAPYSTMIPSLHNTGVWLFAERALTSRVEAFLDASYRHRIMGTTYEPSTISLVGEAGFGDLPGGRLVFPAVNPYNPFGVDITDMSFYLPEMGARENEMTVTVPRVVAGLRGRVAETWDWEGALTYNRNQVHSRWRRFLGDQALQDGLAGRLGGWLNPFGPSDPGVVERLLTNQDDLQYAELFMGDVRARGEVFPGWAGPIQLVMGGEWRKDRFVHEPDVLRANGGLVSLARRPPRDLQRTLTGVYTELVIPLTRHAEFTAAARWEHYRDFGDPVKPKFGLRWRALPELTLRATHSQAFRTPELLQAYTDVQETFVQTVDPRRPDLGIYTMRVRNGGNPALQPEETTVTYAGLIFEPAFLPGFEFSADFWEYRQKNLIGTLGANLILANETSLGLARIERGPAPVPGVAGEVIAINDTFGNYNRYKTNGVDLEMRYRVRLGEDRITASFTAVRLFSAERHNVGFNATESVKTFSFASWRANATLVWQRREYDGTIHLNWIGQQDGSPPLPGLPGGQEALAVVNVSAGLLGPADTQWRVGVSNAFDTDPPRNYGSRTGFTNGFYSAGGRTWFLSVLRRF